MPDTALLAAILAVVGERGLLTDAADTAAYAEDWRRLYQGRTPAVIRPASTEELARVVRLCAEARAPIVPQGGNTSMVGGATPAEDGSEFVLSTSRLTRVRRHRSARSDHDDRGGRHAEGGTECGGGGGVPAAAVDLIGGQRADRRRAGHQCRRQQHGALWQCARSGAGAGSRAAGRHGLERTAPAAQGQHRLLPAPVVRGFGGHAWRHHRRGAEAGAAAARGLRGVVRGGLARRGAAICSAASSRTTRRRSARSN